MVAFFPLGGGGWPARGANWVACANHPGNNPYCLFISRPSAGPVSTVLRDFWGSGIKKRAITTAVYVNNSSLRAVSLFYFWPFLFLNHPPESRVLLILDAIWGIMSWSHLLFLDCHFFNYVRMWHIPFLWLWPNYVWFCVRFFLFQDVFLNMHKNGQASPLQYFVGVNKTVFWFLLTY